MGIIIIVAAIAIPNLLRARVAANEASAVESLRAINSAQIGYLQVYPDLGTYACQLSSLGPPLGSAMVNSTAADLIDIRALQRHQERILLLHELHSSAGRRHHRL